MFFTFFFGILKKKYFLCGLKKWVVSSVGLEHYLDRVGVDGSNPPQPTKLREAMNFKIGDRVKFLNDVGGGVITRIDRKFAYVEREDGFEVPVAMSQLLPDAGGISNFGFQVHGSEMEERAADAEELERSEPSSDDYIDLSGDFSDSSDDDSTSDASVNILMAWIPRTKAGRKPIYDAYLINDCSYCIMYVAAMYSEGAYRGVQAGMLESETTIHLTQMSGDDLKRDSCLHLDALFFKKGLYLPQEPIQYKLKIDEFYIQDAVNYAANDYFDEKALIYNISQEYLMAEIEKAASETQMKFIRQKRDEEGQSPPKPSKRPAESDVEEVDLHIEQLSDSPKSLTPVEMLEMQTKHFTATLDEAIRKRTKRIVFIHGVGNGRLRLEIQRILQRSYPHLRYQDASFKEYGFGATLVFASK